MANEGEPTDDVSLQDLNTGANKNPDLAPREDGQVRTAQELEPVFDVPVRVQAVLGKSTLEVSQLLKLAPGAVVELDRKVGEAIDIYVNNRLVARGEVVLVEDHLGVTMTEIIKIDGAAT
jgi:flagellar motor switch protein FliN/FliY